MQAHGPILVQPKGGTDCDGLVVVIDALEHFYVVNYIIFEQKTACLKIGVFGSFFDIAFWVETCGFFQ